MWPSKIQNVFFGNTNRSTSHNGHDGDDFEVVEHLPQFSRLTEEERQRIQEVLKKQKQFDEQNQAHVDNYTQMRMFVVGNPTRHHIILSILIASVKNELLALAFGNVLLLL
ncbi:uncharacterized protein TRIADDRAFT_58200 [Trichoplax adhaerens]|uniref:Uncharacterized protein n=1 Tax=Trichoplax adhaerens TaxID=10228 RepID=B3S153_TRIAD|nr:predicted protein [Trichoplax adhaerens]EDV23177.1 predicted protein [Trichoplax adhaerens]|eukprot:XP_002114087.1 predicted protein [Trichoplax adhaerens]